MIRRLPLLAFFFSAAIALAQSETTIALLPEDRTVEQAIDHYVDAVLREAKIAPARPADDAEWLRRITLDLVGRIPTMGELSDFIGSTDPVKKVATIDRLMASPGYVRHQAQEFGALLQVQDGRKGAKSGLHDYLLTSFAGKRGWDQMFRDLLMPDESDPKQKGAGDFLKARVKETDRLTIDVSSIFFGVNVSCAQCHDHPHVPAWTQDHFYGMKSFFARSVDAGGFVAEKDFGVVEYIPNKKAKKLAPVMFLTGKTIDVPGVKEPTKEQKKKEQERLDTGKKAKKAPAPPEFSIRAKLVETALEPDQRMFFSRAIVNRLYYRLLGYGLVMPLDQMHLENPASHPELLQWLARDLENHEYKLDRLIRGIVLSNAYARASRWEGESAPQDKLFAVAQVRPLTPMQMAVSLKVASLNPETLPTEPAEMNKRLESVVKSAEKLAAYFPQPGSNFQVGVAEAMLFANSQTLAKELLEGPDSLVARMKAEPEFAKRAELAVQTVLTRQPTTDEIRVMVAYMQDRRDRPEAACQQVVWALLTSAEFRFNLPPQEKSYASQVILRVRGTRHQPARVSDNRRCDGRGEFIQRYDRSSDFGNARGGGRFAPQPKALHCSLAGRRVKPARDVRSQAGRAHGRPLRIDSNDGPWASALRTNAKIGGPHEGYLHHSFAQHAQRRSWRRRQNHDAWAHRRSERRLSRPRRRFVAGTRPAGQRGSGLRFLLLRHRRPQHGARSSRFSWGALWLHGPHHFDDAREHSPRRRERTRPSGTRSIAQSIERGFRARPPVTERGKPSAGLRARFRHHGQ